MATVQEPRAGSRVDWFVEAQIARARRRIQAQDVGIAALGLLAGALAYMLAMVLLDRWLDLSDTIRQLSLFGFLTAAVAYAAIILSQPFRREVNPYFAARRVEQAVPGAKNSVISWLDLHAERLPESIHTAVSAKAAADLKRADVDEVVRDRRLPWLGGIAGGLFVAAVILIFLLRPNQFLSLLGRAFTPFGSAAIASQTSLQLLHPVGGDLAVPVSTPIEFRVDVLGRVPDPTAADAVRLRFRYNPADPVAEEIRLDPSPREPREFSVRVPANRVQTGFVYQVLGGDAATPEYRVQVRSSPLIEAFEAAYHFRPYLRFRDQVVTTPNLEALRGTQVTLTARTNRTVKAGVLEFQPARDGQKPPAPLVGEAVPDQPASLRFKFVLEEDATYKIRFQSVDGERNEDPIPYTIKVLGDHAPQVEVTHPAPDTLPLNGTIAVEGKAGDDFGITAMRLCLQIADAGHPTPLAPRPYRPGKMFKFADDTYPRALDYKDFLPLEQLKTQIGAAVPLKAGLAIEYWLEAVDNCDYPQPNVGKSKVYKVTLADPQPADEKQAAEQRAAGDQAKHDQKQDQDLNQQNEDKKQAGDQAQPNGDQKEKPPEGDQQNPAENAKEQQLEKEMQKAREALARQQKRTQPDKGQGNSQQGKPEAGQEQPNSGQPQNNQGDKQNSNQQPNQGNQTKDQPGENKPGQPQPKDGQGNNSGGQNQPKPGGEQQKSDQPKNQADNANSGEQPKPNGDQTKQGGDKSPQPDGNNAGQKNSGEPKPQPQGGPSKGGDKKDQPQGQQQPGEKKDGQGGNKSEAAGQKAGDEGGKQNGEKNGGASSQPQTGAPSGGEKNGQPNGEKPTADKQNPQGGDKANAADQQKAGNNGGKPSGEPNQGNPPGGNPQDNKPGQPNGTPPNQPPNTPAGESKSTNGNRTPSENPKKDGDGHESPPKPEPGAGGQPGNKTQGGERTGSGPKGDPNNRQPNGQPNENDPGRDGAGSQKGSGQPGGTPDKAKPENAPNGQGQGGAPDAGRGKPKDTPADGSNPGGGRSSDGNPMDKNAGQPGSGNRGPGDLQDAPKGGRDQPGKAPTGQPKTEGTQAEGNAAGKNSNAKPAESGQKQSSDSASGGKKSLDDWIKLGKELNSGDAQTRQAAEKRAQDWAQQALKGADGQKPVDPKDVQAATDMIKSWATTYAADANARKMVDDLKSSDPATREAAEKCAQTLVDAMKAAQARKSTDPKSREAAEEMYKELMGAMAGDGKPGDQKDNNQKPTGGERTAGGQAPEGPSSSPPEEKGSAPDPRFGQTTADLQLERFPKNPSKELLQDLGMTEEQYRQFLKDAAALQKKRQAQAGDNGPARGAGSGRSAANTGVKRVEATGDKKDDLQRGGVTLPPEEYREGYKGFTEDVSKTAGGPMKER